MLDFAKLNGLDIWADGAHAVVDSSKVVPAVRTFIYAKFKEQVVAYRAQNAANVARATTETAEGAAL